jgi:hypothetical protein
VNKLFELIIIVFQGLVSIICSLLLAIPLLFIGLSMLWVQGTKTVPKEDSFKRWFDKFIADQREEDRVRIEKMEQQCQESENKTIKVKQPSYWESCINYFGKWTQQTAEDAILQVYLDKMKVNHDVYGAFRVATCHMDSDTKSQQIRFVGAFYTWFPSPI